MNWNWFKMSGARTCGRRLPHPTTQEGLFCGTVTDRTVFSIDIIFTELRVTSCTQNTSRQDNCGMRYNCLFPQWTSHLNINQHINHLLSFQVFGGFLISMTQTSICLLRTHPYVGRFSFVVVGKHLSDYMAVVFRYDKHVTFHIL